MVCWEAGKENPLLLTKGSSPIVLGEAQGESLQHGGGREKEEKDEKQPARSFPIPDHLV